TLSQLAPQDVDDALRDVNQFLDPVLAARGSYRLYHQSVTDFLFDKGRAQEFWVDECAAHRRVADHYLQLGQHTWQGLDGYGARFLPLHLARGGRMSELRALLLHFDWLHVKLMQTDVTALLADFDLAAQDDELWRMRDTLRLSAHVLAHDAGQLPTQLL